MGLIHNLLVARRAQPLPGVIFQRIKVPLSTFVNEIADEMNRTIDETDKGPSEVHTADGSLPGDIVARHAFSHQRCFAANGALDSSTAEYPIAAGNTSVWSNCVVGAVSPQTTRTGRTQGPSSAWIELRNACSQLAY